MCVPQDLVAVRVFIPVPQLASRKVEYRLLSISLSRLPAIRGYASCAQYSAYARGGTLICRHSLRTYWTPSSGFLNFMTQRARVEASCASIIYGLFQRGTACNALLRLPLQERATPSISQSRRRSIFVRIFDVKCPEYTLFEVVSLELVLLMSRGQMRESASRTGRGKSRRSSTGDCD